MIKNNIEITIDTKTRKVVFNDDLVGLSGENLQGYIIFKFDDVFVNGTPRVEVIKGSNKYIISEVNKVDETYVMPIKSSLLTNDEIIMQLIINETGTDIPVFKCREFTLKVGESINAQTDIPVEYEAWIDIANEKISEINGAIQEVENLNIEAQRVSNGVEVTITDKQGVEHTTKVNDGIDGEQGPQGEQGLPGLDAKINGYNTVTITGGTNIALEQEGNVLHINNIYDDTTILQNIETLNSAVEEHDRDIQNINNDIEELQGDIEDLGTAVDTIDSKIPNQATAQNQLADKNFVNSSIATNTAYFRGTYESTSELPLTGNTPNDYAFVIIYDEVITTQVKQYDRYKWNGTQWVYEYTLNNSSFTAQQWEAINSGITSGLVEKLNGIDLTNYYNKTQTDNLLGDKVDKITGKGLSTNDYTNEDKAKVTNAEQTSNKTTTISSSSTDTQYPSAKAVYDYINSLDANEVSY